MKMRSVCGFVFVIAVVSMLCVDVAFAQRGGRGGGMMRMWGGGNNQLGLLTDSKVQQELELVDDQIKELEEIQQEAMTMVRDMFSEMQDIPREERGEFMRGLRDKMQEKLKPIESRVNEVLLPHQRDRLKQLGFQSSGRGQGAGGALMNEDVLDELDVTDKQKEDLEEAIEKAKEELEKKYKELVKDAENDILKVLDSDQRKKYREMVGEPFQFEERGRRGRDGGDRGDRGRGRRN